MLFPIYVTEGVDESPGLRGVSPLVENLTFAGKDLAALVADVKREAWDRAHSGDPIA